MLTQWFKCTSSFMVLWMCVASGWAQNATPSDPKSWLVLYNLNHADSVAWAGFYAAAHQIPPENLIGLNTTDAEHITGSGALDQVMNEIVTPIQNHLAADPNLAARACGIVLGYRVPGIYGATPWGGPGGLSVASLLQDLDSTEKLTNPFNAGFADELPPPLTKADLGDRYFLVGWIDAPSLDLALSMTIKAQVLASSQYCMSTDEAVYFDPCDPHLAPTWWRWIEDIADPVKGRNYDQFAEVPWVRFDADTESTPMDAFRFGTHDIADWDDDRLFASPPGTRILAYNLNSWGATTVRSTTAHGGRYVPNAIDAGYAAAIGSTGEPGSLVSPYPWVLLAALREERTLGEAMFLSNPNLNWTWACVGDPLLRVTNWFDEACVALSSGDLNCDGEIDSFDIDPFILAMLDLEAYQDLFDGCDWRTGDMNGDGIVNGDDIQGFVDELFS
jgi:uncharacterized protein (TIGR03790 family)